ncbi:MAG: 16S rRNA (cytosine(1402)-N(4))-methyltransferase RsmH [Candidatus Paceibacterota bacterium]
MHIPVLQKEVIEYLDPKPNDNFIDCTLGYGGHTRAILEKTEPKGKVLGIDRDPEMIRNFKTLKRLIPVCDNFSNLKEIVKQQNFNRVSGILFDLGFSSWHLEGSGRGFTFLKNEPLDMRYNVKNPLTAEKIVNYWASWEIEKILREYGEERFSDKIVENIIKFRKVKPIEKTLQLVEVIKRATPSWYQRQRTHFATKTFQALRIAVNDELNNLIKALPQALELLKKDGKLVIISFHSLEDRIAKNFIRDNKNLLKVATKKPIIPTQEEIKTNPRSRSAKLRAAIKIS